MKGGLDRTHDPALMCWVESAHDHAEFPVQNLPFGIFSPKGGEPRGGVAIGDDIVDLRALAATGLVSGAALLAAEAASTATLNEMLALGAETRRALRLRLSELLSDASYQASVGPMIYHSGDCTMGLPAAIGDYSDFYVGIHHATNAGRLFRPDSPLLPNYKYMPIGYHGRASSIRPSGDAVRRPMGQIKIPEAAEPDFGWSKRLDYEVELGVWIGPGNAQGEPIDIGSAHDCIAGLCLLNDWSARDLQAWEYQPLGPFLGKNFHTTISPWIVTAEALAPFRLAQPPRPRGDPTPLSYLWDPDDQANGAYAISIEALISTEGNRQNGEPPHRLSRASATDMYWTVAQMVAHHTCNGCNLRPGDLLGTGTISGASEEGYGSMLELSRGGLVPISLPNGERRTFLEEGDEIVLRATAATAGFISLGFGECRGRITSA